MRRNAPLARTLPALALIVACTGGGGGDSETSVIFSEASSQGSTEDPSTTDDTTTTGEGTGTSSSSTTVEPTTTSTSTSSTTASETTTGESDTDVAICSPGESEACYTGPAETEGVGACKGGIRTCNQASTWGPCLGEVTPLSEVCGNKTDDDCNGAVDDDVDADGDGYGACAGDCCDVESGICMKPALVNPGAYEVIGNDVDDDCDGEIDEPAPLCDQALQSDSSDGLDYARAIDLCQFTTEAPVDPKDKIWGVISAKFSLADGKGSPVPVQRAIRPGFGSKIKVQGGQRLAALSSGNAADKDDQSPPFAAFQSGVDHKTMSAPPVDWFEANGGKLPNPTGCLAPATVTSNDPVMLTLRVRAPTNAKSFSVKMFFFSAEYPEWVCSQYNDFFVALVDSGSTDNPTDKNIAVYDDGQELWPVGVNLVKVASGLFTACQNGVVGCAEKNIPESNYSGCTDASLLLGTGFEELDPSGCGSGKYVGGGTGWLTMKGNVDPGEVFELRLAVWDSGGHIFDSLVLLDDWEWSVDAAQAGLEPQ
ncbi:MAG: choice-of-anchor L domain-containing protein [Nannocystaceae bacterium]